MQPLVLEQLPQPGRDRKARGVGPLAVEALRRRGLGPLLDAHHQSGLEDFVAAHGSPNPHFARIHKFEFPRDRDRVLIWQPELERVLTEHAARLGVSVLREHTLTGIQQTADGVTATVDTPQGPRTFEADHLVGCDGGRSTVRRLGEFDFPGTPPLSITRAGEVRLADPDALPPAGPRETGMLMHGGGMLGTVEYGQAARDAPGDAPLTAEELTASVERVTGARITITALDNPRRFTDGARQATTYRQGRILLAGDAAHVHSPNGGQGLDLGLMDAVNLGWKLAATIRATAPDGMLDSYTSERHPFAAAVLANTNAQAALLSPGPQFEALRALMSELMDLPEVKSYVTELMSRLHERCRLPYTSRYPSADTAGTHREGTNEVLGLHTPDCTINLGGVMTTLYALTGDARPLLIYREDHEEIGSTATPLAGRVDLVPVRDLDHPFGCSAALIRPDGVIAWATGIDEQPDLAQLTTALHTWIGPI